MKQIKLVAVVTALVITTQAMESPVRRSFRQERQDLDRAIALSLREQNTIPATVGQNDLQRACALSKQMHKQERAKRKAEMKPSIDSDDELQLVLALSLYEPDVVTKEEDVFEAALYTSLNQPLFDLIREKGSEEKAKKLLDKRLDIAATQDGCSVLECAAKAQAIDVVRACACYAQYPCPTKAEYVSSLGRLKTLFMIANRFAAGREVKRHIIFSEYSLMRDYINVQYYNLCNGRKLSEFAQKTLEKILPFLTLDHVWFLLKDAHESAGNNVIKAMLDPQSFGDKFGKFLWSNVEYALFRLNKAAK